jgi:hypothetical protein
MIRQQWFAAFIAIVTLAANATAQPVSSAWTYQGQLSDGAAVANGQYDFIFRLYTLSAGGAQVTVQLDFGAVFDGNSRWLDIQVRPGASGGAYTLLTPRQPLTVAPYALYSLDGGNWHRVGSAITNNNTGFVGVNRSTGISGSEFFGVRAPTSGSSYGGMYINTDSDTGRPFYGYKAGTGGPTSWTYLDGGTGDWRVYNLGDRLTVQDNGEIGIGVANPTARLDITDSAGVTLRATNTGTGYCAQFTVNGATDTANGIYAATYGGGYAGSFEAHNTNGTAALNAYKNGGPALRCISTLSTPGTAATDCVVSIVGGTDTELTGGGFLVLGSVASANISIDNNEIEARNNGAAATLSINNDGGDTVISPQGTTRVRVLEITGADLAEKFPVSDAVTPAPGMVVMIDAANPGKLCLASGAYNKKVAGVISGANNLNAGTIRGNLPGAEDAPAVALSGRVWVHCDATAQAIEVGDMLTTSETPGHAMSVSDASRAHGAVIGKAMTALSQGEKGMVLVLVNLQ